MCGQSHSEMGQEEAEVANARITFLLASPLTAAAPCPSPPLAEPKRSLFRFLWKPRVPLVRQFIYCQFPLDGGPGMQWLLMHRHILRIHHLQDFLG